MTCVGLQGTTAGDTHTLWHVGLQGPTAGNTHLVTCVGLQGPTAGNTHLMTCVSLQGPTAGNTHVMTCVGLQGTTAGNTHTHTRQNYSEELLGYEWFVYKLRCMSSVELNGLYWRVIGMCIDVVHIADLLESRRKIFLLSNLLILTIAIDVSVHMWHVRRLWTETRCKQVSGVPHTEYTGL